ncbi:MAG: PQQ-like beta-propeller repeat protein [Phycisphaeraceae bacterium]|nr:MAG: PQQ-like beta-propeller repeat protein [Phycisphaeraceae bacterium]
MRRNSAIRLVRGATRLTTLVAACAASLASLAQGGLDWPQWRGPDRDGISKETGWVVEGKPEHLWSKNVGLGYSSVVVANGRLFTNGYDEATQEDVIWCLDAVTGREIWSHRYPSEKWALYHGGGTNSTPTVDGDRLYVGERKGHLFCFSAADGKVIWKKNLVEEYGVQLPTWGLAGSPYVLGDMVYMNAGLVLAFDKMTGDLKWKSANLGHAYSTPIDFEQSGRPLLAVFNGNGLAILDRKDGSTVSMHEWKTRHDVNAATPIVIGDRIFISSGYGRGCAMLSLSDGGVSVAWENKNLKNQMSGSVLYKGHLYGFDEPSRFKCMDVEGNVKWDERGLGHGCVSMAGDKLLVMTGRGELIIADATPEGFKPLSMAKVLNGGECWTTPVLSHGLIYVRNSLGHLVCRDHRSGANP